MKKQSILSKSLLTFILLILGSIAMYSQCNVSMTKEEHQRYHDYKASFAKMRVSASTDSLIYVPLTIYVITKNDGTGGESQTKILQDILILNQNFKSTNLRFYVCGTLKYINSTAYYNHIDSLTSSLVPSSYNVSGTINVIYHKSIYLNGFGYAGGFTYFPGGDMRIHMSQESSKHTLAHEMGHFWGLPHTFQGSDSDDPAIKELVTRGTGANCATAGDGICDTPADPYSLKSGRTYIDNCVYIDTIRDKNGDLYTPMVNNIMSYYLSCTNAFTQGQYNVIKSYKSSSYRNTWTSNCSTVNTPTALTATLDAKFGIKLTWTDNASNELGYEIEVSEGVNNNFNLFAIAPANTQIQYFGNIKSSTTYYFRIKALNSAKTYSNTASITTSSTGYCIPMNATNCNIDYLYINGVQGKGGISNVSIDAENVFSNTTQCAALNGYDLYNTTSIKVIKGIPYNLYLTGMTGGSLYYAWIDLNNDGDFDDAKESLNFKSDTKIVPIYIDTTVSVGVKRLRIRAIDVNASYNGTPCEYQEIGETEDYQIEVLNKPATLPVKLTATYSSLYTANLSWVNSSLPTSTKCLLYGTNSDGGIVFLDTVLLSQLSYSTIVPNNGKHTFLLRRADNHNLISNMATINVNNIVYCVPKVSYKCTLPSDDAIIRVTIKGETELDNISGCSNGNFSFNSSPVIKLYKGLNYPIRVYQSKNNGSMTVKKVSVWVDYNNNGSFEDANEKITFSNEFYTNIYSGTLAIPLSATTGIKTMRVRLHNYYYTITSCEDVEYEETEEYQIELINLPTSFPVKLTASSNLPYSASLSWTQGNIAKGTKCYIYKSTNNEAYVKADSVNIEQLSNQQLITSNGNFSFYLRSASDNQVISNIASVTVTNYSMPYQLNAKVFNNVVRVSWNTNKIVSKALLYRTPTNYQDYVLKIDTVDIAKGFYDDIRIFNGDTLYTYHLKTLDAKYIISNNASVKLTNRYCVPTFKNTTCLENLNSYILKYTESNMVSVMAFSPTCNTNSNKFTEPNISATIDTLYPNTTYSFAVINDVNCKNNVPNTAFRNISIWLDYNENGKFETTELIYSNPSNTYYCDIFHDYTLPISAEGGLKRLRYIFTDKNYPISDACGVYTSGTGYDKFIYVKTLDITDIEEKEHTDMVNQITVFPNPSDNGKFFIQSNSKVSNIRIYNNMGSEIFNGELSSVPKLEVGFYVLEVTTESGFYSNKIKFISK